MEMRYCKGCFMPSTRPRMSIDEDGFCNGCTYNKSRKEIINWNDRKKELAEIIKVNKKSDSNKTYDCVIGWSGGKDSSAVAISLKRELGLNPLLVTFAPLIPTIEGEFNRRSLLEHGFDSILFTPNQKVSRHLSKRFLVERGDPKVHWNAGINAVTINVAAAYKIPTVFYSEHGESEYGGRILDDKSRMERSVDEILENQIGDDPRNWTDHLVNQRDLEPYIIDEAKMEQLQILYYAHFFPWDIVQNLDLVESEVKFMRNRRGRTYGTFTDFDSLDDVMDDLYYYMQFIKFGFGRCLRDCARQIQRNRMTRQEAYGHINDYDGEVPTESLSIIGSFLGVSQEELLKLVDLHRRPDIWENRNGQWKLRSPLKPEEI
jgi:N-acetyl sugar amidotransferase